MDRIDYTTPTKSVKEALEDKSYTGPVFTIEQLNKDIERVFCIKATSSVSKTHDSSIDATKQANK